MKLSFSRAIFMFNPRWLCIAVLGIAGLSSVSNCFASDLRGIYQNNSGIKSFQNKKVLEAEERFIESLIDLPLDARIHFNLGRTFLAKKEFEKAEQESLTAALLTQNPSVKFMSYFNAAIAATELKKIDEALALYQKALEFVPNSVEVKTNIELLTQAQSGKGEGEGENKQPQDGDKDQKENGEQNQDKPQQKEGEKNQPEKKPKPFKGEELNEADVSRILEELKRQEEQIRARFQREGAKDAPRDKDW